MKRGFFGVKWESKKKVKFMVDGAMHLMLKCQCSLRLASSTTKRKARHE